MILLMFPWYFKESDSPSLTWIRNRYSRFGQTFQILADLDRIPTQWRSRLWGSVKIFRKITPLSQMKEKAEKFALPECQGRGCDNLRRPFVASAPGSPGSQEAPPPRHQRCRPQLHNKQCPKATVNTPPSMLISGFSPYIRYNRQHLNTLCRKKTFLKS
jgi:hypothetical protein